MPLYRVEQLPAQIVGLQQMAEAAYRRFVRHWLAAEINADEIAHHQRIVECLFHRRVRQVEPLLQEIDPQHPLHPDRRAAIAGFGIERLDQPAQRRPRHHPFHLGQKYRPPRSWRSVQNPPSPASAASSPPNLCAPIHLAADYITITGQWLLQRFPKNPEHGLFFERAGPAFGSPPAKVRFGHSALWSGPRERPEPTRFLPVASPSSKGRQAEPTPAVQPGKCLECG